jgi:hypothetical protein
VNVTTAPPVLVARAVMFDGTVTTGGVSVTVIVKLAVPVLVCSSVAEQFTVVVPSGNVEPDAGVQVTGSVPSTTSVALAVNVTAAPLGLVACVVMFDGTATTGGVVSVTVTVKVPLAVLRAASVAVQVTAVVAIANTLSEAGVHVGVMDP